MLHNPAAGNMRNMECLVFLSMFLYPVHHSHRALKVTKAYVTGILCSRQEKNCVIFWFFFHKIYTQIVPTKMKRVIEDGDLTDSSAFEEVTVDPVVRGFIKDWDAMEDLLHHVLYTCLGWEIGEEGQILFTDPLSTPKVNKFSILCCT